MKKRVLIVLLALVLLLPLRHVASANAPVPDPNESRLDYRNVPEGSTVAVMAEDADGVMREIESVVANTADGRFFFHLESGTSFYAELMTPEGTVVRSDPLVFEGQENYRFDGSTGVLEKGKYLSDGCDRAGFATVLVLALVMLIGALGVTIVIELLVGLCFRMRPIRCVIIINLITNPIMNIILWILTLTVNGGGVYTAALVILELAVCGFEFWFYARKYKARKKWVLLIFTLVANAASCAAGVLPLWLLLR